MAWTKGVVVWKGDWGQPESHLSKGVFRAVTDAAALTALVHKTTGLGQYTDCNIYAEHFNSVVESGTGAPGVDANVDVKAMIVLKDTVVSASSSATCVPLASVSKSG